MMAYRSTALAMAAALLVLCTAGGALAARPGPNDAPTWVAAGQAMTAIPTSELHKLLAVADRGAHALQQGNTTGDGLVVGGARRLSQQQDGATTAGTTCERQWFGTATACRGECPEGWREIKRASVCPNSSCNSVFLWINCGECDGAYFGYPCDAFSKKALCERCT